jgi:hypothetical protein
VSGGLYVTAKVGTAGPGDTATGVGATAQVDVTVQAAPWIDAKKIDVVVDGVTTQTITIAPGDAQSAVIRYHHTLPVSVRSGGSYVVIAAYGDQALEPVHPGHIPFGVTNPIFLQP